MPEYTKDEAARIKLMAAESDKTLKTLPISDLSNQPPELIVSGLQALVQTLEQCIVIAYRHHHLGHSEPYPGACKQVMEQSMQCVAVARASRILPERKS